MGTEGLFRFFSIVLYSDCGISTLLMGNLLALLGDGWCGQHQTTTLSQRYDMRLQPDSQMFKIN